MTQKRDEKGRFAKNNCPELYREQIVLHGNLDRDAFIRIKKGAQERAISGNKVYVIGEVYLPADETHLLIPEISLNKYLFNEKLTPAWGDDGEPFSDYRVRLVSEKFYKYENGFSEMKCKLLEEISKLQDALKRRYDILEGA